MLWDGRIHRDFVSGMRRFGATNGKAPKTAKELMKTIMEHVTDGLRDPYSRPRAESH